MIAVDLPGFGLSEPMREKVTIPAFGEFVRKLLDELGFARAHLVGNSMGGFVSSEVAIQAPERVERLVLVSAAGISNASVAKAPVLTLGRAATAVAAFTAARHEAIAKRPLTRHAALALVARYPSQLKADLAWEGLIKGTGKPGFDDALRANLDYDFTDRLPEVGVPTLIIWGENDTIIPARRGRGRAADRRQPQGRDGEHRARADGRARGGVQRHAREVPRRDRPRRAVRAGRPRERAGLASRR